MQVRATSHKPDEIYGIIERLSPGSRKIELFGRPHNVQPNWYLHYSPSSILTTRSWIQVFLQHVAGSPWATSATAWSSSIRKLWSSSTPSIPTLKWRCFPRRRPSSSFGQERSISPELQCTLALSGIFLCVSDHEAKDRRLPVLVICNAWSFICTCTSYYGTF